MPHTSASNTTAPRPRRVTVLCECPSCGGSGLYAGFAEAKGEAVVCLTCDGRGASLISFLPFAGRKRKRGIQTIRMSRGSFVATGVGGTGKQMTYAEFEKKIPAAKVPKA